jgi:hypothetical protein
MAQPNNTDITQLIEEARAEGYTEGIARADRIHAILELCHHHARPELAHDLIRSNATISEVRVQLSTRGAAHSSRNQSLNIDEEMERAIEQRFKASHNGV